MTYTVAITHDVDHRTSSVSIVGRGGEHIEVQDVDEVGRQLARLLVLCQDQSMVVDSFSGATMRGDESTTADVYPPQRRPRINVQLR